MYQAIQAIHQAINYNLVIVEVKGETETDWNRETIMIGPITE